MSSNSRILQNCQRTAKKRGGLCLSKTYINARTPMIWQCGTCHHIWKSGWHSIKIGRWCRKCSMKRAGDKKRHTIELMQQYAKQNNGKCLSRKYIDNSTPLEWQCSAGHIFKATPNSVQQGRWCRDCGMASHFEKLLDQRVKRAKAYIKAKDGEFLKIDKDNDQFIHVLCKAGHTWKVLANSLVQKRSWCQKCVRPGANPDISDLQKLADKREGQALAKSYINSRTKIPWRCKYGHNFDASTENVRAGKWCPICGGMRKSILATQNMALRKGGKCLSEIYEGPNYHKKIAHFSCQKKHTWFMSVSDLRSGHWCPQCLRDKIGKR